MHTVTFEDVAAGGAAHTAQAALAGPVPFRVQRQETLDRAGPGATQRPVPASGSSQAQQPSAGHPELSVHGADSSTHTPGAPTASTQVDPPVQDGAHTDGPASGTAMA